MKRLFAIVTFIALSLAASRAQLATVWHIPDNTSDLGFNMRNPEFAIGASTAVSFYTGLWKWNGATLRANQTGGTLYYKTTAQSAWSSTNLTFYSNTTANQYWQVTLPGGSFNAGDTVQYFFLLTFDGTGNPGAGNTWLYGNNAGSTATASSNTAAASPFTFSVSNNVVGTPVLTVNGVNADYTTTHVFVNEVNNDAAPITLFFTPNGGTVTNVEIFSNLNRRDRATLDANNDGIEDGIIAPDGTNVVAGSDTQYYAAYAMTNLGGGNFSLTLNATKTGAYRLSARFKVVGNPNWFWYSTSGRRDHAIVVSPVTARDMRFYELNTLTVEAQGTLESQRSTFVDLYDGPGATAPQGWNLSYITNLGVNWLWFQPIHPYGVDGRHTSAADINFRDPPGPGESPFTTWRWNGGAPFEDVNYPYALGSPYAVKNFFEVEPRMSKANTRPAAMQEFTNFVAAADSAGVSIMLDAAFNHTAWDVELAEIGRQLFSTNSSTTTEIRNVESRFFSRDGDYYQRAFSAASIAPAPDRNDFGKWLDAKDVFFGRYAALWQNSGSTGKQNDEGDWFDYTVGTGNFDVYTHNVWRYFAEYAIYWMEKTGHPAGTPKNQSYKGIDGLRCDFGQGLPPQAWEYIINRARTVKWSFVWMSESLDGAEVTYRSNRHFDILNENLIFSLQSAGNTSAYTNAFDSRRTWYGQGLLLLNTTSHDEANYSDPWQAVIRFGAASTVDGAPMIFYGQELGLADFYGFDLMERNLGKFIPHFKTYNSMMPLWGNTDFGNDQLYPVYSAINKARANSPALRSSNRHFIHQTSGSLQQSIYSVAKYENAGLPPNLSDVVFAFMNLDRNNNQSGTFNVNTNLGGTNLFGIKPGRTYNVKNIAAYTGADANRRNVWLWPGGGFAGSTILASGISVILNKVPTTPAAWTNAPFEAQYLKLYDVTPPPTPAAPGIGSTNTYVFANSVTFTWPAVTDAEGGISGYRVWVGTSPGSSNVFDGNVSGTSLTLTNIFGNRLFATVAAINNAGIESAPSSASPGIALLNPAWSPVANMTAATALNWSSVSGQVYRVWTTPNLSVPFTPTGNAFTASTAGLSISVNPTNATQFYRIQWLPR